MRAATGAPLLFLHSGAGFAPDDAFVGLLAERYRVIAPSHPGFGYSSLPDWIDSIDDIAHIYLELMDRLDLRARDARRLLDRRLDRGRDGDQNRRSASTKSRSIGPVGVKTGGPKQLDIPDIFAHSTESDRSHALPRSGESARSISPSSRKSRCA